MYCYVFPTYVSISNFIFSFKNSMFRQWLLVAVYVMILIVCVNNMSYITHSWNNIKINISSETKE